MLGTAKSAVDFMQQIVAENLLKNDQNRFPAQMAGAIIY
jgi:hypothetical protein